MFSKFLRSAPIRCPLSRGAYSFRASTRRACREAERVNDLELPNVLHKGHALSHMEILDTV